MLTAAIPHDVAISYKRERRAAVMHLVAVVRAFGFSVWWDDQLKAGYDYDPQIDATMRAAKAVVVLWCSLSVASEWVQGEALLAAKRDMNVVPVFLEDIDEETLPTRLRRTHTIKLFKWDGSPGCEWLNKLLCELEARSGKSRNVDEGTLEKLAREWRARGYSCLADFPLEGCRSAVTPAKTKFTPRSAPKMMLSNNAGAKVKNVVMVEGAVVLDQRRAKKDP